MAYFNGPTTSPADALDQFRTTLVAAGWVASTNAYPYNAGGIDYYVLTSPAASNRESMDMHVVAWVHGDFLRVAACETFTDAATPTAQHFVPHLNTSTPDGLGRHAAAAAAVGTWATTTSCLRMPVQGAATMVLSATLDRLIIGTLDAQGPANGYIGFVDRYPWHTGPTPILMAQNIPAVGRLEQVDSTSIPTFSTTMYNRTIPTTSTSNEWKDQYIAGTRGVPISNLISAQMYKASSMSWPLSLTDVDFAAVGTSTRNPASVGNPSSAYWLSTVTQEDGLTIAMFDVVVARRAQSNGTRMIIHGRLDGLMTAVGHPLNTGETFTQDGDLWACINGFDSGQNTHKAVFALLEPAGS